MDMLPQGSAMPAQGDPSIQPQQAQSSDWAAKAQRTQSLKELHAWGWGFIQKSSAWCKASYEEQWRRWQRNADGIFDPDIAAKKEPWQSKAFCPITPSHRET